MQKSVFLVFSSFLMLIVMAGCGGGDAQVIENGTSSPAYLEDKKRQEAERKKEEASHPQPAATP